MSRVIITSGGTSERIDNVRKITNSSSGKLGSIIANQLLNSSEVDKIYYLCNKKAYRPILSEKVEIIEVEDTLSLKSEVSRLLTNEKIDYFIHSMAVSDYMVEYITTLDKIKNNDKGVIDRENKISSYEDDLVIKLKRTPKIISMIKDISPNTYLVGFKLLDNVSREYLIDVAYNLKVKNKCDLVLANDLKSIREGNHKGFLIKDKINYKEVIGKDNIAKEIIREMFKAIRN